jgi:hypothetical protein
MDAMKLETPTHEAGAVKSAIEGEIHNLVRDVSSRTDIGAERSGDNIALLIEREGATSTEEIDKLIAELQAARSYLHSEGERLQRELSRYEHLSQTAFTSVKVIAQSLGDWRESGHQLHGRPAVTDCGPKEPRPQGARRPRK